MALIDLHVHTSKGSYCSSLAPIEMMEEACSVALDGVCITEHDMVWEKGAAEKLASANHLVLLRGIEVSTDLGHILAFGLDSYIRGIYRAKELRRVADEIGGYLVAAHPFRMSFHRAHWRGASTTTPALDEACKLPALGLVDGIEVLNGACTNRENRLALVVARKLGLPGTGGSDAHSTQGLGRFATMFQETVTNEADLLAQLKAGRFHPVVRLPDGRLCAYEDLDPDVELP